MAERCEHRNIERADQEIWIVKYRADPATGDFSAAKLPEYDYGGR